MKIEKQIDLGREEIHQLRLIQLGGQQQQHHHLLRESSYDSISAAAPVQNGTADQDFALPGTTTTSIDQTSESEQEGVEYHDDLNSYRMEGYTRTGDLDQTPRSTPRGSPKKNRPRELFPLPDEYSNNSSTSFSTVTPKTNNGRNNIRSNSPSSPSQSKIPTPSNKRRKQILARLGLKGTVNGTNNRGGSSSSFRSLYAVKNGSRGGGGGLGDSTQEDSEEGRSDMEGHEQHLRRRYSMGSLRLSSAIKGHEGGFLGSGSESEDAAELHYNRWE